MTLFGQKLLQLDTEQEITEAFACFDEDDDGLISVPRSKRGESQAHQEEATRVGEPVGLRGWLKEYGDRMTDQEVSQGTHLVIGFMLPMLIFLSTLKQIDRLLVGPYTDKQDQFDYVKFAKALKVNDAEEVERMEKAKGENE